MALLFLASGCGGRTEDGTALDGGGRASASESGAALFDASGTARASDASAPATDGSLSDAASDAGRCPGDVIYLAVEVNGDPATTLLETFAPATGTVTRLGPIACADVDGRPVSALAVDRTGAVYLVLGEWRIRRLDTTTFECDPAIPVPDGSLPGPPPPFPAGYQPFGIAFVGDGTGDVLYGSFDGDPFLLSIDVDGGALQLTPDDTGIQLAGTGNGRLFVVEYDTAGGMMITQIAPTTGTVMETYPPLSTLDYDGAPIAVWDGDIYTFPVSTATVTDAGTLFGISRFRPSDGTNVTVAMVEGQVVGSSASTCAPNP